MTPSHFQQSIKRIMDFCGQLLKSHRGGAVLLSALVLLLTAGISSPAARSQAATSETPSITPTISSTTPTPQPTRFRPTQTPVPIPPADQIGSTDGIISLGVVIVVIILGALLWHRQDWARKRPPRKTQSKGT